MNVKLSGLLLVSQWCFCWVPFVQMHMVINIFLDPLIGFRSTLTILLWKDLCSYLLIKSLFTNSNGLLKSKNMDRYLIGTSQNKEINIDFHSKFVIVIYMWCSMWWETRMKNPFLESLKHFIIMNFWIIKLNHIFISLHELQF
jgi:hypothetical protein